MQVYIQNETGKNRALFIYGLLMDIFNAKKLMKAVISIKGVLRKLT